MVIIIALPVPVPATLWLVVDLDYLEYSLHLLDYSLPQHYTMRVAIVGSGVSGIAALWVSCIHLARAMDQKLTIQLLNEHSDHEVNLYEKDSRLGGHTNTVEFSSENAPIPWDKPI